jgi:type VI secretion system protein ImpK
MAGRRLAHAARELAIFGSAFGAGELGRGLSVSALGDQLQNLLERFTRSPEAVEAPADELAAARFALVAWLDEVILRSSWSGRDEWAGRPLQLRLFRTNRAGNEFYEHLARLRPEWLGAREIFLLVLSLGFEGQYHDQPAERRAVLLQQLDTLRAARAVSDLDREPQLTPPAYAVEIDLPARGGGFVLRALVGLAAGLVVAWVIGWAVLHFASPAVPMLRAG